MSWGGQSSVTRSGIPGPKTPNHQQSKQPLGIVRNITDIKFTDRRWFWELFSAKVFRLWPENNYLGNSAGADCNSTLGQKATTTQPVADWKFRFPHQCLASFRSALFLKPSCPGCLKPRKRKRCRQTGSRQSTPLSTIRTRYGNSVSTPGATRTGKNKQKF